MLKDSIMLTDWDLRDQEAVPAPIPIAGNTPHLNGCDVTKNVEAERVGRLMHSLDDSWLKLSSHQYRYVK